MKKPTHHECYPCQGTGLSSFALWELRTLLPPGYKFKTLPDGICPYCNGQGETKAIPVDPTNPNR